MVGQSRVEEMKVIAETQDCGCGCGGAAYESATADCGCGCGGAQCGSATQEVVFVGSITDLSAAGSTAEKCDCGCGCSD
jgi:hypothetical protein